MRCALITLQKQKRSLNIFPAVAPRQLHSLLMATTCPSLSTAGTLGPCITRILTGP